MSCSFHSTLRQWRRPEISLHVRLEVLTVYSQSFVKKSRLRFFLFEPASHQSSNRRAMDRLWRTYLGSYLLASTPWSATVDAGQMKKTNTHQPRWILHKLFLKLISVWDFLIIAMLVASVLTVCPTLINCLTKTPKYSRVSLYKFWNSPECAAIYIHRPIIQSLPTSSLCISIFQLQNCRPYDSLVYCPYSRYSRLVAVRQLSDWGCTDLTAFGGGNLTSVICSPWGWAREVQGSLYDSEASDTALCVVNRRLTRVSAFVLGASFMPSDSCPTLFVALDENYRALETSTLKWWKNLGKAGRQLTMIPIESSTQLQRITGTEM